MECPKCHSDNSDTARFCAECGTKFDSEGSVSFTRTLETGTDELARGTTFAGRYEIIEELGAGGMGRVYRAQDTKLNEEIALKLIKPEIAAERRVVERFRNELRTARKITHKNVCRMYDFHEEGKTLYLTMEYVRGEDLKSLLHRMKSLTIGAAISTARQIAEGLDEAHKLGIVHRDLKPGNIMIDKDGNAKIMDFGIARVRQEKGITGEGAVIGTPEYMSPEQVEGKEADQRSDIYALGVILYEMVTGRVPFEGETPFSVALKHKSETPVNPRTLSPQIPQVLSTLILRCLEKGREKRYQSAAEVLEDLRKIEDGLPTTEKLRPLKRFSTSREITVKFNLKKLSIPASGLIALIIVAVILLRWPHHKKLGLEQPGKPSLAVVYFINNTGDKNFDYWRKALADLLITDLMQSKYLRVLSGESLYDILKKLDLLEAKSYSLEDLQRVADRGGVEHILVGKFAKAGGEFRIDTLLQKASTGEAVGSPGTVQGKGEESFFSLVDELTNKIKANLSLTPQEVASDNDQEVEKITTRSPAAYKFYSEGRRFHMMMESAQSIPLMEKAIALDPNFAMAYRSLAMSYLNQGSESEYKKYLQKAYDLSSNVSERERYIIQGDYYLQEYKTYYQAMEIYKKLLQVYPDDMMGHSKLAGIYYYVEQWDKAIEEFEAAVKYRDDSVYTYDYLAGCYENKGLFDQSIELLKSYLKNVSDDPVIRFDLADSYFYQRKFDLAFIEAEKAHTLDPTYYYYFVERGDFTVYQGDLIKADQEYQKLLGLQGTQPQKRYLSRMISLDLFQGKFEKAKRLANQGLESASKKEDRSGERSFHDWLAYIFRASGNLEGAVSECDKVWASAVADEEPGYEIGVLEMKTLIDLDKKELDKAQSTADELRRLIQKGIIKNEIRHYDHLMGRIELERKNYSQAIDYFHRALAVVPDHWADYLLFDDSLALAYFRSGDLEKARREYEWIISRSFGRMNYPDVFAKAFYMLGQVCEQQGRKAAAVENYRKFLDLWKDADAGLPEVPDAKKRLAAL